MYPFCNTAIETLSLDKSLQRTWELVGGGLSHDPTALVKAYLYTKLRCHFALRGSMKKSFGVRTESKVSRELFRGIDRQFRLRGLHNQRLTTSPFHPSKTIRLPCIGLVSYILPAPTGFLNQAAGARELETAEEGEHETSVFPRDEVRILKTVDRLEPETKLVDVPAEPVEERGSGEAIVRSMHTQA